MADVPAGAYRLAVALRPGFRAESAADTSQQVSVSAGAETSVQFTVRPVVSVADTARAGRADTVTLASGVRVAVTVPSGAAPLSVQVRAAPTDSALWGGRRVLGPTAELQVSTATPVDSAAVWFELPLTAGGSVPDGASVRAVYMLPGGDTISAPSVQATSATRRDPATGLPRSAMVGSVLLITGGPTTLRLAVTRSTVSCASVVKIARDSGFTGTEPLVLLHGLQPGKSDCSDFVGFDPAREVFLDLIAALKNEPAIRDRYAVYTFAYPTNDGVDNAASELATRLPAIVTTAGAKATLVAHSMGGLVARRYLRTRGDAEVNQLITLATPHLGSSASDAGLSVLVYPGVQSCYRSLPGYLTLAIWPLANLYYSWFTSNNRGIQDLTAATPVLGVTEPHRTLITAFHGRRPAGPVRHGRSTDVSYGIAGCYLSLTGYPENDGIVAEFSARPPWALHTKGPYPRDHTQMQGSNASGVNDTFLADLKALLLPSTITVNANVPTSWTLNPGALNGSGTTGRFSIKPQGIGTAYTITPQAIAGRTVSVTNSLGGGSTITLRPGDNATFTIAYSGGGGSGAPLAPDNLNAVATQNLVSLAWSDNSNNETSFLVERASGSSGAFSALATTGPNVAAYLDRAVSAGATYRYRVAATGAAGTSGFSNVVTATVPGAPGNCSPPVPVTGTLSGTVLWAANQPGCDHYVLRGAVVSFADLTIQPGTRIVADAGASLDLRGGSLRAVGTAQSPIEFVGLNGNVGGWRGVRVGFANPANELAHVRMAHAGGSTFNATGATPANLYVDAFAEVRIRNSVFDESAGAGMHAMGDAELPGFANNTFARNADVGARVGSDVLRFLDNASDYRTGNAVAYLDVVPRNSLSRVSHRWKVTTIPHRFHGLTVSFDDIVIDPGAQLQFATAAGLDIRGGSIRAIGTSAARVLMSGVTPTPGTWTGILVNSGSALSEFAFVDIAHGGRTAFPQVNGPPANVTVASFAFLKITNSRMTASAGVGLNAEGDAELPGFAANAFTGNADAGVRIAPDGLHYLDDASDYRTANGKPYIDVVPRNSLNSAPRRWVVTTLPLRFSGTTVSFADLVIDAGVHMQFATAAALDVRGGSIRAIGTATRRIVLEGESPTPGSWTGVRIQTSSSLNEFAFVDVRHGGRTAFGNLAPANVVVDPLDALRITESRLTDSAGWGLFAGANAVLVPANPRVQGNNVFARNALGDVNR